VIDCAGAGDAPVAPGAVGAFGLLNDGAVSPVLY